MESKSLTSKEKKIALVAHDNKKNELLGWAKANRKLLPHELYATGTTGRLLEKELGIRINKLQKGYRERISPLA